jgi:hypothetical protein
LLHKSFKSIIGSPDALIALKPMPKPLEVAPEPKASRVRVWQACDRVLRSGRRPTVEGIREILGGGSPNSVTAYINEWYRELGSRLAAAETPLAGFPPEAVSLMTELWRVAATDQAKAGGGDPADDTATRMLAAERDALEAEAKALQTLNQELQRHRSTAEKSLAEARALLARREAALDEERARGASLDQALAQARLELEVVLERQRLAPAREPQLSRKAPSQKSRPRKAPRSAPKARAIASKRPPRTKAATKRVGTRSRTRRKTRNRKRK